MPMRKTRDMIQPLVEALTKELLKNYNEGGNDTQKLWVSYEVAKGHATSLGLSGLHLNQALTSLSCLETVEHEGVVYRRVLASHTATFFKKQEQLMGKKPAKRNPKPRKAAATNGPSESIAGGDVLPSEPTRVSLTLPSGMNVQINDATGKQIGQFRHVKKIVMYIPFVIAIGGLLLLLF